MDSAFLGRVVVVMGVSGAGKSASPPPLYNDNEPRICKSKYNQNSKLDIMALYIGFAKHGTLGMFSHCDKATYYVADKTVGRLLSKEINCTFIDADDIHSESNKDKMKEGIPLSDEDRGPWLSSLRSTLQEHIISGESLVLACSALKTEYREVLRLADPNYISGNRTCMVEFVFLNVSAEVLADRLSKRAAEGGHFMPETLLQSQLDLLEIDDAEGVLKIDGMMAPEAILNTIQETIIGRWYGRAI